MSLFSRAFVNGVNYKLAQDNIVGWPSKEAAELVCDAIADDLQHDGTSQGVSTEKVAHVVNSLVSASAQLRSTHGYDSGLNKIAAESDVYAAAGSEAVRCMNKAAEEVAMQQQGGAASTNLVDQIADNSIAAAASVTPEAKAENAERPAAAYNVTAGQQADAGKGSIGTEAPAAKPDAVAGQNSVTQATSKAAEEVLGILNKLAMGESTNLVDQTGGNTLGAAAQVTPEGAAEEAARPSVAYRVPVGATALDSAPGSIGHETPHPEAQPVSPPGANSATEMTDKAAFLQLFNNTAEDVGSYLPPTLGDNEKVAAVKHMMWLDHDGRQAVIEQLWNS